MRGSSGSVPESPAVATRARHEHGRRVEGLDDDVEPARQACAATCSRPLRKNSTEDDGRRRPVDVRADAAGAERIQVVDLDALGEVDVVALGEHVSEQLVKANLLPDYERPARCASS